MEKVSAIPKMAHLNLPGETEVRPPLRSSRADPRPDGHQLRVVSPRSSRVPWCPLTSSRGAFDSTTHEHLPQTPYDIIIDETSNKPGEQRFEKQISGLYLGELFRLIMCEMIDEGVLFLGQETYKVEKPYAFDTAFLSLIEACVPPPSPRG